MICKFPQLSVWAKGLDFLILHHQHSTVANMKSSQGIYFVESRGTGLPCKECTWPSPNFWPPLKVWTDTNGTNVSCAMQFGGEHTVHGSVFLEPYIASKMANTEFSMEMESRLQQAHPKSLPERENLCLEVRAGLCCLADGCSRGLPGRGSRIIS